MPPSTNESAHLRLSPTYWVTVLLLLVIEVIVYNQWVIPTPLERLHTFGERVAVIPLIIAVGIPALLASVRPGVQKWFWSTWLGVLPPLLAYFLATPFAELCGISWQGAFVLHMETVATLWILGFVAEREDGQFDAWTTRVLTHAFGEPSG